MNTNLLRSVIVTLALGSTLLFGALGAATAQYDFFPSNATINYSLPWSSWSGAVVGYANQSEWSSHTKGTSPTVDVVAGASIPSVLFAYNSSVVNMSGGSVANVSAQDSSVVNMTGGSIGQAGVYDAATVNVSGGHINGYLSGLYGGTVNVDGGKIGNSSAYAGVAAGSTMNISGGTYVSGVVYVGIATDPASGVPTMGAATLNMYGARLWSGPSLTIASVLSTPDGYEYTLKGTLIDGTNVTGLKVFVVTGSVFNLYNVFRRSPWPLLR